MATVIGYYKKWMSVSLLVKFFTNHHVLYFQKWPTVESLAAARLEVSFLVMAKNSLLVVLLRKCMQCGLVLAIILVARDCGREQKR